MSLVPTARPDGPKVRKLRLHNGWTQVELGQRIGRTQPAISKVERGAVVSHVLMRQVAKALKVKLSDITLPLDGDEEDLAEQDEAVA